MSFDLEICLPRSLVQLLLMIFSAKLVLLWISLFIWILGKTNIYISLRYFRLKNAHFRIVEDKSVRDCHEGSHEDVEGVLTTKGSIVANVCTQPVVLLQQVGKVVTAVRGFLLNISVTNDLVNLGLSSVFLSQSSKMFLLRRCPAGEI